MQILDGIRLFLKVALKKVGRELELGLLFRFMRGMGAVGRRHWEVKSNDSQG